MHTERREYTERTPCCVCLSFVYCHNLHTHLSLPAPSSSHSYYCASLFPQIHPIRSGWFAEIDLMRTTHAHTSTCENTLIRIIGLLRTSLFRKYARCSAADLRKETSCKSHTCTLQLEDPFLHIIPIPSQAFSREINPIFSGWFVERDLQVSHTRFSSCPACFYPHSVHEWGECHLIN